MEKTRRMRIGEAGSMSSVKCPSSQRTLLPQLLGCTCRALDAADSARAEIAMGDRLRHPIPLSGLPHLAARLM
jgi:hypothetical protein